MLGQFLANFETLTRAFLRRHSRRRRSNQESQGYTNRAGGEFLADFCEVESGMRSDREQLLKAIELCRKTGAKLICSKLDRIARNTRQFLERGNQLLRLLR